MNTYTRRLSGGNILDIHSILMHTRHRFSIKKLLRFLILLHSCGGSLRTHSLLLWVESILGCDILLLCASTYSIDHRVESGCVCLGKVLVKRHRFLSRLILSEGGWIVSSSWRSLYARFICRFAVLERGQSCITFLPAVNIKEASAGLWGQCSTEVLLSTR